MQTYFADLLAFFGISGAPQTFAELIPWMFGVLVALGTRCEVPFQPCRTAHQKEHSAC